MMKRFKRIFRLMPATALILAASFSFASCSAGAPAPTPTPTPPVTVGDASFEDGTGADLGFKLLYALDSADENGVLGTAGIVSCLSAIKLGAAGTTDTDLSDELGMQDMLPKDIESAALRLSQSAQSMKNGSYASAWSLFMGENQYFKESYITLCEQSLQLDVLALPQSYDNDSGNKFLGEWADDKTGGRVKLVNFKLPQPDAPFFVDIFTADPDWQAEVGANAARPLPFQYESGDSKAVPTMVCLMNCGIYSGSDGAMAILPTVGDESRLLVMLPAKGVSLHDFIPIAAANYSDWYTKAEWGKQRVLLPKFKLSYEGSIRQVLGKAGLSDTLKKGLDFSALGNGLYFGDILHKAALTVDESGIDPSDSGVAYNPGVKDGVTTLTVDRPFLAALIKTQDDHGNGGQFMMMGVVRDPLNVSTN